jgi:hypothetical protein
MIFYGAALLGLVPLGVLAVAAMAGRAVGFRWWTMAAAFGVSVLADAIALVSSPPLVSQAYPLLQAGLFVAVLAPSRAFTEGIIGVFLLAASVSITVRDAVGLDMLLRMVAWGTVAGLAWAVAADRLRAALLVYFGLGAALWACYVAAPGWVTWGGYQMTRALGVGLWSAAAWQAARRPDGTH